MYAGRITTCRHRDTAIVEARLTLRCAKQHGVLARVIATLRRAGYQLNKYDIRDSGGTSLLSLDIEGETSVREIRELFAGTKGVLEIDLANADHRSNPATVYDPLGMLETDLVQEMAGRYPDISQSIIEYQKNLGIKSASLHLHRLGKSVATVRAQSIPLSSTLDFENVVNNYLLPELAPIAEAELDDAGLKVSNSIFTGPKPGRPKTFKAFGMSLELTSVDRSRCDFLCGYIQGLLDRVTWLPPATVAEVYCRNEGQPYCLFDLG